MAKDIVRTVVALQSSKSRAKLCMLPQTMSVNMPKTPVEQDGCSVEVVASFPVANSCMVRELQNEEEEEIKQDDMAVTAWDVRSRSQDRLWNEATRFYEAVGEDANRTGAQEIIEDGSSCSEQDTPLKRDSDERITTLSCVSHTSSEADSQFSLLLSSQPANQEPFAYRGIAANPPEITKRGVARGNAAQIHRKAWLEVSDAKHRYGKNLRLYYRHWESLGCPTNNFFQWLDDASGDPLPSLDACPRKELDSDTVLYITDPEVTMRYALRLVANSSGRCSVLDASGAPVCTGPGGWMFVLRDGSFYGARKVTSINGQSKQRFHHSSFFGGKAVAAAGIFITNDDGFLTRLYPHSGHYRPGEVEMQRTLFFLHKMGVNLDTFQVDTQQLIHVNRHSMVNAKTLHGEKKTKKVDSLNLKPAVDVFNYLAHKARSQRWMVELRRARKAWFYHNKKPHWTLDSKRL